MNKKSVGRRPDYIAFRIPVGTAAASVIAHLRHGGDADPPWAFWHSSIAPWGELKRAPENYVHLGIDEPTARRMINLIAAGQSLPPYFSNGLPILTFGVSNSVTAADNATATAAGRRYRPASP
jgi:hypothetical protein